MRISWTEKKSNIEINSNGKMAGTKDPYSKLSEKDHYNFCTYKINRA